MRYRRRTPQVDAVEWTGGNLSAMPLGSYRHFDWPDVLVVCARNGDGKALTVMVPLGYWVVTDGEGWNVVLPAETFRQRFEAVNA